MQFFCFHRLWNFISLNTSHFSGYLRLDCVDKLRVWNSTRHEPTSERRKGDMVSKHYLCKGIGARDRGREFIDDHLMDLLLP